MKMNKSHSGAVRNQLLTVPQLYLTSALFYETQRNTFKWSTTSSTTQATSQPHAIYLVAASRQGHSLVGAPADTCPTLI